MIRNTAIALAIALCTAVSAQAAGISLSADETLPQSGESIVLAIAGETAADMDFEGTRGVPELGPEMIFAIALLVTLVASIPGRVR